MRTNLLPHNKTAYKKVMKAFETADKTCVIHPTGTGKSYLIAAVSESYNKVLILAPNIFVLGQVESVTNWHPTVDYMTYAYLNSRGIDKQYDLIVLDEFHRAGATEWGEAVKTLLSQQHGKVLGTTATPIRYLDEGRNMAEEIFDGNIASQMSIGEAWNRNILPIPTYVTGLFDFKNTAAEVRERIKAARHISDKTERLKQLSQFELDWESSEGMPQVIRKHISQDVKRVIVFCNSVRHLNTMRKTITDWFRQAGLNVADIYSVCHETDSENTDQMEAFEQDTTDGVKIMLAVNMLNEGIHIPRVDAVIMLRTTASRIIYMQQLGRCLTAANTARPVVLDMVDNISNANVIGDIKVEFEELEQRDYIQDSEHKKIPRQFTITDYTQGIRKVIAKLTDGTANVLTIQQRLDMVEEFAQQHGRLPIVTDNREHYNNWMRLLNIKDQVPRVYELMELYPRRRTEDVIAEEYVRFCKEHNRLPASAKAEGEKALWVYMKRHREVMLVNYPEVKEQFDKFYRLRDQVDERMQIVVDFYIKNKRLPSKADKELLAYTYVQRHGQLDKLNELLAPYKPTPKPKKEKRIPRTDEELYKIVESFCKEKGRLPRSQDVGGVNASWVELRYHRKSPMSDILFNKYKSEKNNGTEVIGKIKAFVKKHGRLPNRKSDALSGSWLYVRTRYNNDPRIEEIRSLSKYDKDGRLKTTIPPHFS